MGLFVLFASFKIFIISHDSHMRQCLLLWLWLTLIISPDFCTDLQCHDLFVLFLKWRPRKMIPKYQKLYKNYYILGPWWALTMPSFFTNVFQSTFQILEQYWWVRNTCFPVDKVREFPHSYLLRPGSSRFPASHLCRVSSVKDPVKPTPPEWSSQPHSQWPLSPKRPKICAQQDAWDWQS